MSINMLIQKKNEYHITGFEKVLCKVNRCLTNLKIIDLIDVEIHEIHFF